MMAIRLPRVREPKWYKVAYGKERFTNLAKADVKQGTWFLKPYWDVYKQFFKSNGISWQMLMEAWGLSNVYFVLWLEDKLPWEEAFNKFEEALNRILKKV